ncbi:LPXTG cell wall anchor domain-containing protein [Butyrivibrio sp. AE3006]|uniref:LPXTG cell wall anchor domain-containing protein n=1 Tax=Butyrivibrio sp. AE3006 TaxID=1280673 RepID=UPI00040A9FFE|nr:LPXTG cell wall anchor domain-containing protein [Butyrivibrio sp. AE3006]
MARKNSGQRKAEEYIKRHAFAKRWGSVMLVMAMLVTTVTLYAMNRAASAVTEEGADEIGMVLETEDLDLAEMYSAGDDEEAVSESEEAGGSEDEYTEETSDEGSEDTYEEEASEEYSEDSSDESAEDSNEEDTYEEETSEDATEEYTDDSTEDATEESSEEDAEEATEDTSEDTSEDTEEMLDEEVTDETLAGAIEDELMQDVELTVSYVDEEDELLKDEDGEAIADEKKISLMDSMIFEDDARTIDGYNFKEVIYEYYNEDKEETEKIAIEKITVMIYTASDDNGYKYYEVVPKDDPETEEDESEDVMEIKLDTNLTFVYEKVEEEVSEEEEQTDKTVEIPESVDLAKYVTKTVIERQTPDGEWEEITEDQIMPGDSLRITIKYELPEEASASDDIHYELPSKFGTVESTEKSIDGADGTVEVSEDNKVKVQYSDEHKQGIKEKIQSDDSTEENSDDNAGNGKKSNDSAGIANRFFRAIFINPFAKGGLVSSFFNQFVIVAHAEEGNTGNTSSGEFTTYTSVPGMQITGLSVTKNPQPGWLDNAFTYSGGTPISSGADVGNGDTLLFTMSYKLGAGTLSSGEVPKYNLADHEIDVENDIKGYIYNKNNVFVGTFFIDSKTDIVTFDFEEEFAKLNDTQPIEGKFFFAAKANLNENENEKPIHYDFGGPATFDIRIVRVYNYDLGIEKKGNATLDANTKTINYSIKLTTNQGSGDEINLEDVLTVFNDYSGNNGQNDELTNKINVAEAIKEIIVMKGENSSVSVQPTFSGNKFSMSLKGLKKGESYTITYKLVVPDDIVNNGSALKIHNKANAKYGKDQEVSMECDTTYVGTFPDIYKKGSADKSSRTVTWTIKLNTRGRNLKGFTLSDKKMNSSIQYVPYEGNVTVTSVVGGNGVTPSLTQGSTISLKDGYKFEVDDYSTYTFTYSYVYTNDDVSWDSGIYNKALILNVDKQGNEYQGWVGISDNSYADKKNDGYEWDNDNWVKLKWNVSLLAPIYNNDGANKSEYWTYEDIIRDSAQVITEDQLTVIENNLRSALTAVNYAGTIRVEKGEQITVNGSNGVNKSGYKGFKVYFYGDLNTNVKFSYYSYGYRGDGSEDIRFYNNAIVYGKEIGDSIGFDKLKIEKKDGNRVTGASQYEYYDDALFNEGILTWIIKFTIPLNTRYDKLVVTDTLPENVTLIENGYVTKSGITINGLELGQDESFQNTNYVRPLEENTLANYEGKLEKDGRNIRVSFNPQKLKGEMTGSSVDMYLRVRAKINGDFDFATLKKGVFTNTVKAGTEDNDEIVSDLQTQTITKTESFITKSAITGIEGTRNTVEYSLDINPNASDLLPNGDTLTLTDNLVAQCAAESAVTLLNDSIKVYQVITDEQGNQREEELDSTKYSYETTTNSAYTDYWRHYSNTGTIVFKIPDKMHLKVKYRYTFTFTGASNDEIWPEIEISNTATLEGVSVSGNNDQEDTKFVIDKAGVNADVKGINVFKKDKDTGAALANAVFKLYKWNGTTWEEVKEYTSAADGLMAISDIVFNNAYKLAEITPPAGYLKSDKELLFYISASDEKEFPLNIPKDFQALGGMICTQGQEIPFVNESKKTSITINKNWVDADAATKPNSISVKLARRYVVNADAPTGTYYTVHVDHRSGDNGNITDYTGFPSVKAGSTLKFTIYGINLSTHGHLPTVTVNGNVMDVSSLFDTSGEQFVEISIPVDKDLNVTVRDNTQMDGWDELHPSISSDSLRSADSSASVVDDTDFHETITITPKADGTWSWDSGNLLDRYRDVEIKKENGEKVTKKCEYLYYITEVNSVYYTAEYSENNTPGINSGELTITNTRNDIQPYSLPSTGGSGRLPFTIGGIALVTLALVGEEIVRKKRRKYNK